VSPLSLRVESECSVQSPSGKVPVVHLSRIEVRRAHSWWVSYLAQSASLDEWVGQDGTLSAMYRNLAIQGVLVGGRVAVEFGSAFLPTSD